MKQYTTLLMDVDDTLLDFGAAEAAAIRFLFSSRGYPVDDSLVAHYSRINKCFWRRFERGEIPKEAIFAGRFAKLFAERGIEADPQAFANGYMDALSRQHFLIPGALELCQKLRGQFALYIVTNGVATTQYRRIEESGLKPYFQGIFVSEEAGSQKPSRDYFRYVFDRIAEKDLNRVIIVGDSLSSDMRGGIDAGIDTCWYNPHGLTTDLPVTYTIERLEQLPALLQAE